MKTPENWRPISYADWSPGSPRNRYYDSWDNLPGILDDDLDFFEDDFPGDVPW